YWICPERDESNFINKRIAIRIRKITLDSDNNEDSNTCDLYIDKISFYQESFGSALSSGAYNIRPRTCEKIIGLFIKATVSDSVQSNKLACLMQANCWVYNFSTETWEWKHTRNPAFWFLYFAHGG